MKTIISCIVSLLVISCGTNPEKDSGFNSVALSISLAGLKTKIDSCSAKITGSDMDAISKALTITDSAIVGSFAMVPTGKNRILEVSAYNSEKVLVYFGKDTIDVLSGSQVEADIVLNRVAGSVTVKGTIKDSLVIVAKAIAYYPLDGDAKDLIGGHNGTIYGSLTTVSNRASKAGSAYHFGQNNYISIPKLGLSGDVSFFGWFRMTGSTTPYHISLLGQGTAYTERWSLLGSKEELTYYDRRTTGDNAPYAVYKSQNLNQWYSLCAVSSDSFATGKKVKMYLNGALVGEVSARPFSEINTVFDIGRYWSESGWVFSEGDIDDLIIFNSQLTPEEVKGIHENGYQP